jgi:hypothetical protein
MKIIKNFLEMVKINLSLLIYYLKRNKKETHMQKLIRDFKEGKYIRIEGGNKRDGKTV